MVDGIICNENKHLVTTIWCTKIKFGFKTKSGLHPMRTAEMSEPTKGPKENTNRNYSNG